MFDSWLDSLTEKFELQLREILKTSQDNQKRIRTVELSVKRLEIILQKFVDKHQVFKSLE